MVLEIKSYCVLVKYLSVLYYVECSRGINFSEFMIEKKNPLWPHLEIQKITSYKNCDTEH